MLIEIRSEEVFTKTIQGRDGRPQMDFREQPAAILDDSGGWPTPFKISLPAGAHPYRPGHYTLDNSSFVTDEYGRLKFARELKLKPSPAPIEKAGK